MGKSGEFGKVRKGWGSWGKLKGSGELERLGNVGKARKRWGRLEKSGNLGSY